MEDLLEPRPEDFSLVVVIVIEIIEGEFADAKGLMEGHVDQELLEFVIRTEDASSSSSDN